MNLISVANSLQNFSASPEEKLGCSGNKFGSPVIFPCLCERENNTISWTSLELERRRRGKQLFKVRPLFRPLCSISAKIRPQNCPATLLFILPSFWLMGPSNQPVGNTDINKIDVFGANLFNFYFGNSSAKILINITNKADRKNSSGPRTSILLIYSHH